MQLVQRPTPLSPGVMVIRDGAETKSYYLTPLPCGEGSVYLLDKLEPVDGEPVGYKVELLADGQRCGCKAHQYRGACRHVSALQVLIEAGKLE